MPGYDHGESAPPPHCRRRDRDGSSGSRDRQAAKRKRNDAGKGPAGGDRREKDERRDKKDKKSKKDKRAEKDRRHDALRADDRDGVRARRQEPLPDPRRSSQVHDRDRDPLEIGGGRGGGGQAAADAPSSDWRPARSSAGEQPPAPVPAKTSAVPPKPIEPESGGKNKRWRAEVGSEDERDLSEDEEVVEKKLEEAKRRREALKAKHAANAAVKESEEAAVADFAGAGGDMSVADFAAGVSEGDADGMDAGASAEAEAGAWAPSPSAGDM